MATFNTNSLNLKMIQFISNISIIASLITLLISLFIETQSPVILGQFIMIAFFLGVKIYLPKCKNLQPVNLAIIAFYALLFFSVWQSSTMMFYQTRLSLLILLLITNVLLVGKARIISLLSVILILPITSYIDFIRMTDSILRSSYIFILAETILWSLFIFTMFEIFRRKLVNTEKSLTQLSISDPLTKSYNMRYFDSYFDTNSTKSFTLAMIDLDNFKQINDEFGHQEGDQALIEFTDIVKASIRQSDLLFRYGGDEFIIIFNDCLMIDAVNKINEIKIKTQTMKYPLDFSVGFSDSSEISSDQTLMDLADKRMYITKKDKKSYETLL